MSSTALTDALSAAVEGLDREAINRVVPDDRLAVAQPEGAYHNEQAA